MRYENLGWAADNFAGPVPRELVHSTNGRLELLQLLGSRRWRHGGSIRCMDVEPSGGSVVTGGHDHQVRIWEFPRGRQIACLRSHEGPIVAVKFHPDGQRLFSVSSDGRVRMWSRTEQRELATWTSSGRWCPHARFSEDARRLVLALPSDAGDRFEAWDLEAGRCLAVGTGCWRRLTSLALEPAGACAMMGDSRERFLEFWDARTATRLARVPSSATRAIAALPQWSRIGRVAAGQVVALAWHPSGPWLALSCHDGAIILFDLAERRELRRWQGHRAPALALAWSGDGRVLCSAGFDGKLFLWDPTTGEPFDSMVVDGRPRRVVLRGNLLLSANEDTTATIYRWR
ncbi:MAG: WD40 repeat domain-containing protein [Planctomycetes bacterium]|nr:WD40 repeat domain-containing protein [Planctomycetota bacterium]